MAVFPQWLKAGRCAKAVLGFTASVKGASTPEVTNFLRQLSDFSDDIRDTDTLARKHWFSPDELLDLLGGVGLTWVNEVPAGNMDNVNTTFTISFTPTLNSFSLYLNGVEQTDWATLTGTTIIYRVALKPNDQQIARYTH